jgi:hypothetical protein
VIFRDNPLLLQSWVDLTGDIAARSENCFAAFLATSHPIAAIAGPIFAEIFALDATKMLLSADFDRVAYSRDLCGGEALPNQPLVEALGSIRTKVQPDYVISWSENKYLRRTFPNSAVLFMEFGPLPRTGLKPTAFLDPFGHQHGCAFQRFSTSGAKPSNLREIAAYWRARWVNKMIELAFQIGFPDWLESQPALREKKKLLIALQPADWLNYEGIGPRLDPISLLRRIAHHAPADWVVIPQWHLADPPPDDALLHELAYHQPNVHIPPPGLRLNRSDVLLPLVDGVATISSNVAAAAAILGKRVHVLGRSKFEPLHTDGVSFPQARTDILAFLLRRYCRPIAEWTGCAGAFMQHLSWVTDREDWLFDMTEPLDVTAFDTFFPSSQETTLPAPPQSLNDALIDRDRTIANLENLLMERDRELLALRGSTSWKATMPLRVVSRALRSTFPALRKPCRQYH